MSTAWTSSAIPKLMSNESDIQVTLFEASNLVTIAGMLMIISAIITGIAMNFIGRKICLILSTLPSLICYLIMVFSNSLYMLYVARGFSGFSDGIITTIIPAYVGEVSSANVRGLWGPVPTVLFTIGQLFVNCIGGYLSLQMSSIISCILPILFSLTLLFIPESPYFYIMHNHDEDAKNSLKKLLWKGDIEDEFQNLKRHIISEMNENRTLLSIFLIRMHLKALCIVLYLRFVQFLCGIYIFMSLAQYLFQLADIKISPRIASIIFYIFEVTSNFLTSFFINKMGRRFSMQLSTFACGITLLSLALYFWIRDHTNVDLSSIKWFPLLALVLYHFAIALGITTTPTIVASELFSPSVKNYGLCMLNITYGVYLIFSTMYFNFLLDLYGIYFPFAILAICLFIAFIITMFILPETKDKTLEEIQMILKG